jgi:hypothetical protein
MKYVFGFALVVAVVVVGGEIVVAEFTNALFQDDLGDITAMLGTRIGLSPPTSEEQLRAAIGRKADGHQIPLDPKQVTVRITGPMGHRRVYIAVDYTVHVNLLVYSFPLHFTPKSTGITF